MYFFGLSKEQVLSQKHIGSSCKDVSNQNPINMITLFGSQVYPMKNESSKSGNRYMLMKDIDLRLPADHYTYDNFHETLDGSRDSGIEVHKANEASVMSRSGERNPKIVIDLEKEPPVTEETASVSYVLDLNSSPVDESISEPRYCFLQDLNCPYIEDRCEKSGIDDAPPLCSPECENVHTKDGTASPASDTSCCTMENNSRRSSSPLEMEPSCRTRLEFPVAETGCCNDEDECQMAAESLVHISTISHQSQHSYRDQDSPDKAELRCSSCDSYELLTLGIIETNNEEDLCVSSMAMDEVNNNNKEIGVKLRRGRRMKNFQKEILPSLTSLSRHEIREDINILEAVLRSKEYKKMQGKTKDVKFRTNPRNKRSVRW